jgi:hypothetical protein
VAAVCTELSSGKWRKKTAMLALTLDEGGSWLTPTVEQSEAMAQASRIGEWRSYGGGQRWQMARRRCGSGGCLRCCCCEWERGRSEEEEVARGGAEAARTAP